MVEEEWDERKRRSNLAKHGVDFAAVVPMLQLPDRGGHGRPASLWGNPHWRVWCGRRGGVFRHL
ncbi:MAG: hypothetical protein EXQ96_08775 [Alphaproteobacteria bacterium]|nr:hypothetical protein [Alphaproteobacteria bacterium]